MAADPAEGVPHGVGGGQAGGVLPQVHERSDGDIKRAAGQFPVANGQGQGVHDLGRNRHGALAGRGVQTADRAVGRVCGQQPVQMSCGLKQAVAGVAGLVRVGSAQRQLQDRAHGVAAVNDARLRQAGAWQAQQEQAAEDTAEDVGDRQVEAWLHPSALLLPGRLLRWAIVRGCRASVGAAPSACDPCDTAPESRQRPPTG